ncbi:MAG: DUF5808 domain-containing protein [Polyangiaceae bacterium]
MSHNSYDIQGYLFGVIPYDFRRLSWAKAARRMYRPGGSMLAPKVFGVGWTLNFAHPGSRWLLAAAALCAVVASLAA